MIDDPEVDIVVVATRHDSHAALTAQALRAGKHVWCEKPLALSEEELDEVEAAWRVSGAVLFVGFNRRFADPVRAVKQHLLAGSGPLVVTYRVSAGVVPQGHWYRDRRQGGRLLGEVCHFVDTCAFLVGESAAEVQALSSSSGDSPLSDDVVLALRYPGGSVATVSYAGGGHPSTAKERIEVHGRSRSAVIDDFQEVRMDTRVERLPRQDKGHDALAVAFRDALSDRAAAEATTLSMLESTWTTLAAAASVGSM